MFVTNCISTTKIQKISEITNFFRHYFLSRTEVMSWIRRCQPLWDELQEMGYEKTCKSFTPKQVKAIIDKLGEPGY